MNTNKKPTHPQLLTTEDLMALLQVSRNTITRWVTAGKIKCHTLKGTRRHYFLRHEIEESLQLPHLHPE